MHLLIADVKYVMFTKEGYVNHVIINCKEVLMIDFWDNSFFKDNLDNMQDHIPDESVDLLYLDPTFNSKATYNT